MGRRNILPDEASRLRGKRYLLEKQAHGGQKKGIRHNDESIANTHERLAKEYGVSPKTIERDAEYAQAIETIEEVAREIGGVSP